MPEPDCVFNMLQYIPQLHPSYALPLHTSFTSFVIKEGGALKLKTGYTVCITMNLNFQTGYMYKEQIPTAITPCFLGEGPRVKLVDVAICNAARWRCSGIQEWRLINSSARILACEHMVGW